MSWSERISSGKAFTDTSSVDFELANRQTRHWKTECHRQIRWGGIGLRDNMEIGVFMCWRDIPRKKKWVQRSSYEWKVTWPLLEKEWQRARQQEVEGSRRYMTEGTSNEAEEESLFFFFQPWVMICLTSDSRYNEISFIYLFIFNLCHLFGSSTWSFCFLSLG